MHFGSCCISNDKDFLIKFPKSIKINGVQRSLILNLEIIQTFINNKNEIEEDISYIFPNDNKFCIYDTIFIIGNKIIKPKLATKEEADKIYMEAVNNHKFSIFASNIAGGLTEFKVGQLPPKTELKIILKIAFTGHLSSQNSFFFKFPLDACTPSGSRECIYFYSKILMNIQCEQSIKNVTSNLICEKFNKETKIFSVSRKFLEEYSIILYFHTYENIKSSALLSPCFSNNDYCAVLISPNIDISKMNEKETSKEFIFVVDCSGSMSNLIKNASECLEIFIKSLPQNSYFNIIFFGTHFHSLFENSVKYDQITYQKAIDEVQKLEANLGGTDLSGPLRFIFGSETKYGQRQIFILTDGEIDDNYIVFDMVKNNAENNRCFTVGIGRGCDAGLVEGIAKCSGGKCSFVSEGDLISEKVIPQLNASFYKCMNNIEIHVEGDQNNSFLISPYPIPHISFNDSLMVYFQKAKTTEDDKQNAFSNGFLICGKIGDETIEFQINQTTQLQNVHEDELGCSKGHDIGKAIRALFSFNYLQKYEKTNDYFLSKEEKQIATQISLSGGILSKYTGFVGCIDSNEDADNKLYNAYSRCGYSFHSRPTFVKKEKISEDQYADDDFDDSYEDKEEEEEEVNQKDVVSDEVKLDSFDLMEMMRGQKFDGYWENLSEVNRLANTNINSIEKIKIESDQCLQNKCICTFIAIAAIHVLSPQNKNTWSIVIQKAENWLKKTFPNENIEEIIEETEQLVKIAHHFN